MIEFVRLFGKIRLHPLTILFIVLSILTAQFYAIFLMLTIVLLHELGHAAMATYFKWPIERIQLLPFGGELEIPSFGTRPMLEEALVVVAGPFQHVLLFGFALLAYQFHWLNDATFKSLMTFNFTIFITNLYPVWPLDGGRLLFLALARVLPVLRAHKLTLIISITFLLFFLAAILILAPTHLSSWILFGFLVQFIWREIKGHPIWFIRFLLAKNLADSTVREMVAQIDEQLMQVLRKFYKNNRHIIVVKNGTQVIGVLEEERLLKAFFEEKTPFVKIGDLL